ncbi:MAG: Heterodimeric efflux ABC transporter, permease/ATP-binding subunit 1 [uncultured Rubrobacteraceae bacterium]|uniref:Heterodimeric efflux ABC transporter, permease/ATP-binding subunit 1 n=1 Tax=uncultured Rubrobacteraceae bacterium TaxID=349277 RepID=A0A6J4R015_9ACTN|nr:MAG: Heterodimeric efflux ABC transporter, permease/ATP-binding subunit 1 [uncultured Rubrobacteraceae bacterium]
MARRQEGRTAGGETAVSGSPRAVRRALAYLRSYKREAAGAFVALILSSAASLATPQLIRVAIDEGIVPRSLYVILLAVGGLVGAALMRGLFQFLQGYLAERASQGVAYDLRNDLFAKIERLGFGYYDKVETGQLVTRLTSDVEQIRTFAGSGVVQLAAAAVMLVGTTTLLFSLNWRLALIALAIIPVIVVLLLRFVRRIGPLFRGVQQTLGRLNSILQEDLAGIRVIRTFAREDYERERYRSVNEELLGRNLETVRTFSNNFPFVFLLANLGTLLIILFGGLQVIGGGLTVGELVAFNTYLGFLLFPILTIGFLAAGISRAGASSQRVFEVLDALLEVEDAPNAVPLPPVSCRVEFDDISFRYPGDEREILRNISFTAEPGQTVAILGTTGSGKSTLVNLIPRFYDVTEGSVKLDGHDVRDVTLSSLRGQIGIVLQTSLLFSGPVRDNIAYGRPDATQTEIEAAARAANAHEFIRELPQGYDSMIGERGVGLSGGQRQRIAIARALLVDPRLLILDDSTSAVDAETETAIQESLDQLMREGNRTAFVIAQRASTVRDADLILVLDGGTIVAQGTHEELLSESELYNEILRSQIIVENTAATSEERG